LHNALLNEMETNLDAAHEGLGPSWSMNARIRVHWEIASACGGLVHFVRLFCSFWVIIERVEPWQYGGHFKRQFQQKSYKYSFVETFLYENTVVE
jgi:hypothetical protein